MWRFQVHLAQAPGSAWLLPPWKHSPGNTGKKARHQQKLTQNSSTQPKSHCKYWSKKRNTLKVKEKTTQAESN